MFILQNQSGKRRSPFRYVSFTFLFYKMVVWILTFNECLPTMCQIKHAYKANFQMLIFFNFLSAFLLMCNCHIIVYFIGIQYSDSQFLKVILHFIVIIKYWLYMVIKYILVLIVCFIANNLYLLIYYSYSFPLCNLQFVLLICEYVLF